MIKTLGLISAIILPLWNIPLIIRIIKRRSSKDISLLWALGVWFCLLGMFPAGLLSTDIVWKTFNIINLVLFTVVTIYVIIYHKGE
ncbi:MAG: hypothetical protein PHH44_07875 [bacterium]|jgi:uncharacterized protein with PQ loop repeat|nr:hypothetical protein [bacterium]